MWPNEPTGYREQRQQLLEAESALRSQMEAVARLRRNLPLGGIAGSDYRFIDVQSGASIALSDLFEADKDTLLAYNLMYKDEDTHPCVMCASMLDSLNGAAKQASERVSLAIIAKASPKKIADLAAKRRDGKISAFFPPIRPATIATTAPRRTKAINCQ